MLREWKKIHAEVAKKLEMLQKRRKMKEENQQSNIENGMNTTFPFRRGS